VVDDEAMVADKRIVLVDNVLSALQQLAHLHRKTLKTTVVGITGTNGKTTTKELAAAVLAQQYNVLYTLGNLNNHIGVPLTLLRLKREHDIAVIEMGANHPGEIAALAAIAGPDYGLITNVGYAHLEGFGSLEGVIKAKGELYGYLQKTNGQIFINQDNNYLTSIAGDLGQIKYGEMGQSEEGCLKDPYVCGRVARLNPCLSLSWQCEHHEVYTVQTNLVGGYNLWNVLAAITIGMYFKISCEKINEAITNYVPTNNRSQLKKTAHNELIIDAYNANPSSMSAALENFVNLTSFRKAIILGDMLELGDKSTELHAAIVRQIDAYHFEKVLLCGEQFSKTGQQYTCFPTVEELNEYLITNPLQGYSVLIKGSRRIQLDKTIELL
jgi:UDP-N-acetylmuramoyl-tripeptide--D-alanyl-D-alanine ligase